MVLVPDGSAGIQVHLRPWTLMVLVPDGSGPPMVLLESRFTPGPGP